jgi:FkbM family methyltransferase
VRELYGRAVYFPKPEFGIRPGDVVLDLGCNEGLFSLLAAASGASVTGVDAQGGFARDFSEHMTRNRCGDRAAFVHAIIGGSAGLFRDPETLRAGSAYTDAPQVRSMEELTAPLPRIDFLKVDVEGSEFAIFRGDQPWIAKVRKIAMEVHPEHGRPADIADWLAAAGFNVFATGQGYIYAQRMALDSAERRHAA